MSKRDTPGHSSCVGQHCQHKCGHFKWGKFYEQFCQTSSSSTSASESGNGGSSSESDESDEEVEVLDSSEDLESESDTTEDTCSNVSSIPSIVSSNSNVVSNTKKSISIRPRAKASICLDLCSYDLVGQVAKECGMRIVPYETDWDVLWSDPCINQETHLRLKRFQRTNHFPRITELCRKNALATNLNLMKDEFPKDYNFFPTTWILPQDYSKVRASLKRKKSALIIKPDNGSNGHGIFLVRNLRHLQMEPNKRYICQEYIDNPFLIDGYKFDIRVYTLITSCDPLRIYTHSAGLVRFATVKYEKPITGNLKNRFMHLTNYSVNKKSNDFVYDGEIGSKRKISTVNEWLDRNGYNVKETWARIDDVIIKSILSAEPSLKRMYSSVFSSHCYHTACFQLLGFDILLDDQLNPYVLEINHSPSFFTDTALDVEIKQRVLHDTFKLCRLKFSARRKVLQEERFEQKKRLLRRPGRKKSDMRRERLELEKQWEEKRQWSLNKQWAWEKSHRGNFRLIYPCADGDKYEMMCRNIENQSCYYKDTISSNMRRLMGRAIQKKAMGVKVNNSGSTANSVNVKMTADRPLKIISPKVPMKVKSKNPVKTKVPSVKTPKTPRSDEAVDTMEYNKETERLVLEWVKRKELIKSANLEKLIYFRFKQQNNLSEQDHKMYGYLG